VTNPFDVDPVDETISILPGDSDCNHTWVAEESRVRTFGGVDVDRVKTCEECGEVREIR